MVTNCPSPGKECFQILRLHTSLSRDLGRWDHCAWNVVKQLFSDTMSYPRRKLPLYLSRSYGSTEDSNLSQLNPVHNTSYFIDPFNIKCAEDIANWGTSMASHSKVHEIVKFGNFFLWPSSTNILSSSFRTEKLILVYIFKCQQHYYNLQTLKLVFKQACCDLNYICFKYVSIIYTTYIFCWNK